MNRNLKNEEVKKYITIGAVLIILYWALQNLQLIFSVMSMQMVRLAMAIVQF